MDTDETEVALDRTPDFSWPSFAAGSVFSIVVFALAQLALRAA